MLWVAVLRIQRAGDPDYYDGSERFTRRVTAVTMIFALVVVCRSSKPPGVTKRLKTKAHKSIVVHQNGAPFYGEKFFSRVSCLRDCRRLNTTNGDVTRKGTGKTGRRMDRHKIMALREERCNDDPSIK